MLVCVVQWHKFVSIFADLAGKDAFCLLRKRYGHIVKVSEV